MLILGTGKNHSSFLSLNEIVIISVSQQTLMGYTIANKTCRLEEGLLRKYCNSIQECLTIGPGRASAIGGHRGWGECEKGEGSWSRKSKCNRKPLCPLPGKQTAVAVA